MRACVSVFSKWQVPGDMQILQVKQQLHHKVPHLYVYLYGYI